MSVRRYLGRTLFHSVPAYNRSLYELCARYVDRFNGDNNSDPEKNGEYSFLRSELPKIRRGGAVFDVGANIGNWAAFALSINPQIHLHCFEPSKATFAKLNQKQWPSNVCLNNLGVGEVEGMLELNLVEDGSGLNSLYLRRGIVHATAIHTEKVLFTTIDKYCESHAVRNIHLIKVDVEGHELAVFKGMTQMLSQGRVHAIQFEYGGCNLDARVYLGDIWELIESYGFRFYKLYPEGPRRMEKYMQALETFKYSNWIACHESQDLLGT
jgi:FkbM family methyltransferase